MSAPARTPLRLGVMIGGGGRTLINLADCIERGMLGASIAIVIAPRENLAGVTKARERRLPIEIIEPSASPPTVDDRINRRLIERGVDLVCMAGYVRYFRADPALHGRVMNIHPALLPSFGGRGMYGMAVHHAVLDHGCKVSGCTVHFVDEHYDNGPIVLQRTCPVLDEDTPETLASRVFAEECRAYPEAVRLFAEGRLRIEGRRVRILPAGAAADH
jgi:formyltetrahydrofolate-dependent phosphoribosylglycinamide formyltransferase